MRKTIHLANLLCGESGKGLKGQPTRHIHLHWMHDFVRVSFQKLVHRSTGCAVGVQFSKRLLPLGKGCQATTLSQSAWHKVRLHRQALGEELGGYEARCVEGGTGRSFLIVLGHVVVEHGGKEVVCPGRIDRIANLPDVMQHLARRRLIQWVLGSSRVLTNGLHGETNIRLAALGVPLPRVLNGRAL